VKTLTERGPALDERWWYGAAHRYLGAYYAALPSFAGRDLAKSKDHFERSLAIAPDFLATRVLMAEYWARAANDRRAYREQLERVLAASPDAIPEVAPEQRLEQKKARRLLAEIDDYFEPEEPAAGPEKGQ
jgi:predicted anti-sigma-YlaC factor YlaD